MKLSPNDTVAKCPKCGNNTEFEANSLQVAEDCCEVWVVCACGFDPTSELSGSRYEDTWGGVDNANIRMALDCWNDAIADEVHR
jgi:hypothetical protein